MSRMTDAQSMTKYCDTLVSPGLENSRRQKPWSPCTDMSMAAWPSIAPARPLSACSRAASTIFPRTQSRNPRAMRMIISGPPTNSAAVNCQPMTNARIRPSSTTRFVEATSNAMADDRLAPLRKSARARATAA